MAIGATFKSGNFNTFDAWVKGTLFNIPTIIRHTIIPAIDKVLTTMIGRSSGITKNNIDVFQIADKEGLHGFLCNISYIVEDFNVTDAPEKAVEEDQNSLREALSSDIFHLKDVVISKDTGEVLFVFEIPV